MHSFPVMHRVTIHDQEHLPFHRTQQTAQKARSTGCVNRLWNTMKRSVPRLVMVEIILQPKRWPVPGITGVCPRLL